MDSTASRRSWSTLLKLALAVVGVGVVAWLVRQAGPAQIADAMRRAAPWLPLLLLVEAARIAVEIAAVQRLYELLARPVARAVNVRAHLVAYAIAGVAPGGRGAAEAAKAAILAPHVGGPIAAAAGATNQALVLLGNAFAAVLVFGFAAGSGAGWLAVALLAYVGVMLGLYGAIVWLGPRARVPAALERFRGLTSAASRFRDAMERLPAFPVGPALLTAVGRLLQGLKYAIALHAVSRAPALSLVLAAGAALVGAAAGDPIPGQLGATEGALALWADTLEVSVADAVAAGLLVHAIQLGWVLLGALTPLVWPVAPAARAE